MHFAHQVRIFILLLVVGASAMADTLKDALAARQLSDRVMAKVGEGDSEGGLRIAKPYLIIPPAEFDVMLDQLKMQQPMMAQRFGKSIGYEFIREDKIGTSLLRIVQIHRFEKHVMRWSFYFYRGSAGWVLDTFKTDDDIRQLFPM
jgi:hypothetical protein